MTRFIGIDSAWRNTGIVILDSSGALISREHVKNQTANDPEGFWFWNRVAENLLRSGDVVALEGLSFGSHGRGHVLAAVFMIFHAVAFEHGHRLFIVPPMRAKKWALGSGKATKPQMIKWAKAELGLGKKDKISEHEADALSLAQIAQNADMTLVGGLPDSPRIAVIEKTRQELLWNKKQNGIIQCPGKSYFDCKNGDTSV